MAVSLCLNGIYHPNNMWDGSKGTFAVKDPIRFKKKNSCLWHLRISQSESAVRFGNVTSISLSLLACLFQKFVSKWFIFMRILQIELASRIDYMIFWQSFTWACLSLKVGSEYFHIFKIICWQFCYKFNISEWWYFSHFHHH